MYQKFLKENIDLVPLGVGYQENAYPYFCTPKGANIIGWAGVDGIHYCFIRGFGEMVFAISPMSTPGNYVHPLAKDFSDFLRLLLACQDAAALEQAYCWNQEQFDAFLRDNPPTDAQQAVLNVIQEKLHLAPMEQAFSYLKELQAEFDYSSIKFTEDYYDFVPEAPQIPEWKVYFEGNFWGHQGRDHAGKEVPVNKQFTWGNECWQVPAMYICRKGLVIDFCVQISVNQIRAFMEKWNLSLDSECTEFDDEQQAAIDAENPLSVHINPQVNLNGSVMQRTHGCSVSWNPGMPENMYNGLEAKSIIEHYSLDPSYGWVIWRFSFPWKTKRKPQIRTLRLSIAQEPIAIAGPHFRVAASGEQIEFTHPITGVKHTLIVQEYEQQEMSQKHWNDETQEFPSYFTVMSYTLTPELSDRDFAVTDTVCSDHPRQKQIDLNGPTATNAAVIGIIGSADGPTAIALVNNAKQKLHATCSALHFQPEKDVEWRIVFNEKTKKDISVHII